VPSAYGKDWKAVNIPFQKIASTSGGVFRRYELSDRTVAMLLSQTAYMHWHSRWENDEPLTDAQKELIRSWAQQAEAELFALCTKEQKAVYPANDPKITYAPNDPFNTPELIPDGGYIVPPWYTNPAIPLPGVDPNDAMVNLLGLPALAGLPNIDVEGLLAAGLPRFRINWLEDGQKVAIHFVSIPNGGQALITIDGGVGYVNVVDLNTNLTALPLPEFPGETIEEISIIGEGEHYIDVTFIPVVDDELLLPIQFGGGLRKVTITQTVEAGCEDSMPFDVRQDSETPCILQKSDDNGATWADFADITLCLKNSIVTSPDGGISIVSGGETIPLNAVPDDADPRTRARATRAATESEIKCLAAANAANVMQRVIEEAIAKYKLYPWYAVLFLLSLALSFAFGAPWGALLIPAAQGAAAMLVFSSLTAGAFSAKEFREFACILHTNCTVVDGKHYFDFNAVKTAVVAKQPSWSFNVWNGVYSVLEIIGETGLNIAGDTTAITDPCCDFCSTGTQSTYLYLTSEPYFGSVMSKNANNNNIISKSANGLRMSANGSTPYFRWDFAFQLPPGSELTELGVYMTNNGEPFYVSLFLNQVTTAYRTYSNYRPFGQFHYSNGVTGVLPGMNRLIVAGFNNNTLSGYFEIQRVYAVYRGCDPFLYYR